MAKRTNDAGIVVYDCVVCEAESIFPLCTDCQLELGKPAAEIAADWKRYLAMLTREPDH